jgi:hypothetical protein
MWGGRAKEYNEGVGKAFHVICGNGLEVATCFAGGAIVKGVATGIKAAGSAAEWLRNGNNFLRVGGGRISMGPALSYYRSLPTLQKIISPIHIHMDKKYGGIDFNWFKDRSGNIKNWTWWKK